METPGGGGPGGVTAESPSSGGRVGGGSGVGPCRRIESRGGGGTLKASILHGLIWGSDPGWPTSEYWGRNQGSPTNYNILVNSK
jgi:hypothetical protein